VASVALIAAVIPNKHYNINSDNNGLTYDLNGAGDTTLSVPVGQYTTTTLMAYLATQIAGTTWTQNATTQKINILTTTSLDISIGGLADSLGINTALSIAPAGNDNASDIPDLAGTDMFLIESSTLASNNMVSSLPGNAPSSKSVFATVPVDVFFGANQSWSDQGNLEQSRITYDAPRNISRVDIKITDQDHNTLDLQSPVTLIFRIYY
jgi:hypothetical protein